MRRRSSSPRCPATINGPFAGSAPWRSSKPLAKTGAGAEALQTYTAETITLDVHEREFFISNENSLWKGTSLFDLYKKAYTPWEWHAPIMKRAQELGMVCFGTPFHETAVDFLESLGAPAYKIASFENVHLPLIRKVAATGKPLIISTGLATLAQIHDAVNAARGVSCKDLVLLKCTSTYPASPENSNVLTIPNLRDTFGVEAVSWITRWASALRLPLSRYGATVIEKHFTLRRADGGVDSRVLAGARRAAPARRGDPSAPVSRSAR